MNDNMLLLESHQFQIPDGWNRSIDEDSDQTNFYIQSPGVTFAILGCYDNSNNPLNVVQDALDSLREEHPAMEVEELPGESAIEAPNETNNIVRMEATFMTIDFIATSWLQSWKSGPHTLFLMVQTVEQEKEDAMKAFCKLAVGGQYTETLN